MDKFRSTSASVSIAIFFSATYCGDAAAAKPASHTTRDTISGTKMLDAIVIHQEDNNIGQLKLYLTSDRARVDAMNGQVTILSEAPNWNCLVYNRDRQYFELSHAEWHEKGINGILRSRRKLFEDPEVPKIPVKFMGRKAIRVSRRGIGGGRVLDGIYQQRVKRTEKFATLVTYTASSDFKLSKGAFSFVEGLYLTAPIASILLESTSEAAGKPLSKTLSTSLIKEQKVAETIFKRPDMKLTKGSSLAAVVTGKGIEEMMLNFSGSK